MTIKVKLKDLRKTIREVAEEALESVDRVKRHEDGREDSLFDEAAAGPSAPRDPQSTVRASGASLHTRDKSGMQPANVNKKMSLQQAFGDKPKESVDRVNRHNDGREDSLFDEEAKPEDHSKPLVQPGEKFVNKFKIPYKPAVKKEDEDHDPNKTLVLPSGDKGPDVHKADADYQDKLKQGKQAAIKNVAAAHKEKMGGEGWKFKEQPGGWSAKLGEDSVKEAAPAGNKAKEFLDKAKQPFKDKYGKDWAKVLYATAEKHFGKKK
jgi:hypothetical protein